MQNGFTGSCELKIPYPAVRVEGKNVRYARILSSDFAGRNSESTAVNQYFYQHLILSERFPELSNALECISLTEMRHMEMLGELIVLLGGDPQIGSAGALRFEYWNGSFVNYAKNPKVMLANNIKAEEEAINAYRKQILLINDRGVRSVLERIILDEENHIRIFRKYLTK